ncbi:AAA family ATPase [Microbacterium hominis]|uniref:ATP-dependent nuclease n=1 Tax=Microbacterium TaxID=33882 RepID=UPI00168A809F|nr:MULTISPECIES: AAA family ATPase [Microbacterium]QOC24658.1 AAA family ATPase [Microbacterium hominis]QOC28718.1 AAA family ATPase [Microbacterium hominis]QYF99042.1 AAA family ATPase [Microbacterium sp. PAMC21962]
MSEISPSDRAALAAKVARGSYGKYLRRVILRKVRGFENKEVSFDFPVTALVGPNGGGKTTILGAASLAYRSVEPGRFFAKSGRYDSSMVKWSIEHGVIDKTVDVASEIRRSVNFPTSKWNRTPFEREVLIFGVTRTVPATERSDLRLARGSRFKAIGEVDFPDSVRFAAQKILGKSIDGYSELDVTSRATLFAAVDSATKNRYTEFHFGAGEASIIRIVSKVEAAPENSLILVEEIENGLHPVAVRRLVDYLLAIARDKSCQVIFTTHSSEAIEALPPEAVWAAFDNEVVQGALNIEALRSLTGRVESQIAIFVEDDFAVLMVKAALRYFGADLAAVAVHGVGGASQAVKVHDVHNADPTRSFDSVAIVDGDQRALVDSAAQIYALPGVTDPEAYVFDVVLADLDSVALKLTAALNLPVSDQDRVKRVVRERALTNHDRHVIYQQIGEDLDLTAELTVQNAFLGQWAQLRPAEVDALFAPFEAHLPMRGV